MTQQTQKTTSKTITVKGASYDVTTVSDGVQRHVTVHQGDKVLGTITTNKWTPTVSAYLPGSQTPDQRRDSNGTLLKITLINELARWIIDQTPAAPAPAPAAAPVEPKRLTFKLVNKELAKRPGYAGEELVQGEGYLYFAGGNADAWRSGSSIYAARLNHCTLEQILDIFDVHVRDHAASTRCESGPIEKPTAPTLTPQQRAQAIIDGWRGLPGELMMLKGVLCAETTLERAYKAAGMTRLADAVEAATLRIDGLMIAARMDELIAAGGGN